MSLNVMVVDDSAVVRSMIVKTLRLAGLPLGETLEAGDGKQALDLLEKNWVDLLFVDINMPVMTGEELLRLIRARDVWADLPVVVVSTEGSQTRIRSLLDPKTRFVHKPFTPETIRDVVIELTGIVHEDTTA